MAKPTKAQQAERQEAIEELRELIHPGDTLYTILQHRSSSGMYLAIDVYLIRDNVPLRLSWSVARATGLRYDERHEAVGISGCGRDMGFDVVHRLSRALFPDGFECIGSEKRCPSNDHVNGDRNYEPHMHSNGGYALRHKWI